MILKLNNHLIIIFSIFLIYHLNHQIVYKCLKILTNMGKKICFFSAGFAFNRLNRMRFYEKALPKDTEMFLFTTDRWHEKGKEAYQFEWSGLKRTKIIVAKYDWTLPLTLRQFCKKNKIDRIINIGNRASMVLFLPATLFSKTEYIFNLMGWVPIWKEILRNKNRREFWDFIFFYFFAAFARKITANDYGVYKRFTDKNKPLFFRIFKKIDVSFLPPPVDTESFKPKDKKKARKKLGIPLNKKVIIFVGRVKKRKGADVLMELIKRNKNVLFIVIGKSEDKKFEELRKKQKNVLYFEKKNPEELNDYYSAADIAFLFQRIRGSGLGQVAHEALACGVPTFAPAVEIVKKTPVIFQIPQNDVFNGNFIYDTEYATNEAEKIIKDFFRRSKKERVKLSKMAREFALENYSHKVWIEPHIREYLY